MDRVGWAGQVEVGWTMWGGLGQFALGWRGWGGLGAPVAAQDTGKPGNCFRSFVCRVLAGTGWEGHDVIPTGGVIDLWVL